jgi:intracellular sulfur oxidation DsrE/DsrF family protein
MSDAFWINFFGCIIAIVLALLAYRRGEIAVVKANGATALLEKQLNDMSRHQTGSGVDLVTCAMHIRNLKVELDILKQRMENLEGPNDDEEYPDKTVKP